MTAEDGVSSAVAISPGAREEEGAEDSIREEEGAEDSTREAMAILHQGPEC